MTQSNDQVVPGANGWIFSGGPGRHYKVLSCRALGSHVSHNERLRIGFPRLPHVASTGLGKLRRGSIQDGGAAEGICVAELVTEQKIEVVRGGDGNSGRREIGKASARKKLLAVMASRSL